MGTFLLKIRSVAGFKVSTNQDCELQFRHRLIHFPRISGQSKGVLLSADGGLIWAKERPISAGQCDVCAWEGMLKCEEWVLSGAKPGMPISVRRKHRCPESSLKVDSSSQFWTQAADDRQTVLGNNCLEKVVVHARSLLFLWCSVPWGRLSAMGGWRTQDLQAGWLFRFLFPLTKILVLYLCEVESVCSGSQTFPSHFEFYQSNNRAEGPTIPMPVCQSKIMDHKGFSPRSANPAIIDHGVHALIVSL